MVTKKCDKSNSEIKRFGITIGFVLSIMGSYAYWKDNSGYFLIIAGVIIIFIALILPLALKPFYSVLLKLSSVLGAYLTKLILIILYYFLITPIGLTYRLFGKQFLELRWDDTRKGYWHYRNEKLTPKDYENQF